MQRDAFEKANLYYIAQLCSNNDMQLVFMKNLRHSSQITAK